MKSKKLWFVLAAVMFLLSSGIVAFTVILNGAFAAENVAADRAPSSFFKAERGASLTDNCAGPATAVPLNGIRVDNSGAGSTVSFKNAVDISKNTKNDIILSFLHVPANVGEIDIGTTVITLTDAVDPDNYVRIKIFRHQWVVNGAGSFFFVEFPGVSYRGLEYGFMDNEVVTAWNVGTEVLKSLNGIQHPRDGSPGQMPMDIRFDAEEKAIYTTGDNEMLLIILKLDDPRHVGAGKEWKGFSSGLVNLSVTVSDMTTGRGSYMIFGVNGNSMSGAAVNDTKAPAIKKSADKFVQIPAALVGKDYPVFTATAFDDLDGVIDVETISITAANPSGASVPVTDGYFRPSVTGPYTLRYSVSDSSDNEAMRAFTVPAAMSVPPIELIAGFESLPAAAFVGERIKIPSVDAAGGSGELKISASVIVTGTGKAYPTEDNGRFFTPLIAGEYAVVYNVSDYYNTQRQFMFYINVTRGAKPVCSFPDFYPAFLGGKNVMLPKPGAYDYVTSAPDRKDANVKIEYKYAGEGAYTELNGFLFTPSASKASVSVRYTVWCGPVPDSNNSLVKEYADIPIVNPTQFDHYFIKNNGIITPTYNQSYVDFNASADSEMTFINSLSVNNLDLLFVIPNTGTSSQRKNNFNAVEITLTDSLNSEQKITFTIHRRADSSKSDVYYNGTRYEMTGGFDNVSGSSNLPFEIKYKNDTLIFSDYNNVSIFKADFTHGGLPFYGFTSGRAYLKIGFVGVGLGGVGGSSGIRMQRIGNQSVFARYNILQQLQPFTDNAAPVIEMGFDLELDTAVGKTVLLPAAKAYDVLDSHVDVTLTLTDPDGIVIFDAVTPDAARSFVASKYGIYRAVYRSSDSAGRAAYEEYPIFATYTHKPDIALTGSLPAEVSLGAVMDVPGFIATDIAMANPQVVVFVQNPRFTLRELTNLKNFKFEMRGTYTFYYYATNGAGNTAIRSISVKVV